MWLSTERQELFPAETGDCSPPSDAEDLVNSDKKRWGPSVIATILPSQGRKENEKLEREKCQLGEENHQKETFSRNKSSQLFAVPLQIRGDHSEMQRKPHSLSLW